MMMSLRSTVRGSIGARYPRSTILRVRADFVFTVVPFDESELEFYFQQQTQQYFAQR